MSGGLNTLGTRLKSAESIAIATGVIAPTQQFVILQAESGTADDLATINITSFNDLSVNAITYRPMVCLIADTGDTITIKHGTGNITLPDDTDVAITDGEFYWLIWNGTAWKGHLVGAGGGAGAPDDAEYLIRVADAGLANAQVIGSLATGLMMSTTTTGVVSTIKHNSGQYDPTGRLSLSGSLAHPTASTVAQSTLYYHPFKGDTVWLYNGTIFLPHTFASVISIAIPSTADTNYDVFVYDNAGTLTLELLVWTSATTRTSLGFLGNREVRGSDATRLYIGTIRTDSVSGQCSMDFGNTTPRMNVWNRYHQVPYAFVRQDNANFWTYAVDDTWRAANANANGNNRVEFVIGLDEKPIRGVVGCYVSSNAYVADGIALDATNANHAQIFGSFVDANGQTVWAEYRGSSGVGSHYLQWVESQEGTNTSTWYGDNTDTNMQAGLIVDIWG